MQNTYSILNYKEDIRMKNMTKLLATILVLSLLLVSVAFADGDTTFNYEKYDEPVVLNIAKHSSAAPGFLGDDTASNNPMTRFIKDNLNVDINVIWETEISEFPNKLALMMAAGSLPDTFTLTTNDYLLFHQMMENDMLAPLDEVYDEYANDYIKDTLATYNGLNSKPFYGEDGKLYAIAGGRYSYEHNQLWLRQDWLDASGFESPSTLEEMESILQAWKEAPPVEGYVGMLLNATNVGGVYDSNSAAPIFGSFDAYPNMWVTGDDGKAVWGSVQPQVKEGLAVLADWYSKGLIDQQFITRTAAGAQEAVITGNQTGLFFAPWWLGYAIGDFNERNPEAVLNNANAPLDADGNFNIALPGASGSFVCVRKDFEHPEAVVKVMNLEFDMWRGFNDEAAALIKDSRDNGVDWEYLFPTSSFNLASNNCVPDSGAIAKALVEGNDIAGLPTDPQVTLMGEQSAEYAKLGNEAPAGSWLSYITRYIGANPELMHGDNVVGEMPAFSFVTESMADLKPNLDTLEQTTFLKIVTGELPVDAFDQFVSDWYAQGGQMMTDEVNELIK